MTLTPFCSVHVFIVCRLAGAVVLELGGGVGLATLAAALHAKIVICTGKVGVATQVSHSLFL